MTKNQLTNTYLFYADSNIENAEYNDCIAVHFQCVLHNKFWHQFCALLRERTKFSVSTQSICNFPTIYHSKLYNSSCLFYFEKLFAVIIFPYICITAKRCSAFSGASRRPNGKASLKWQVSERGKYLSNCPSVSTGYIQGNEHFITKIRK